MHWICQILNCVDFESISKISRNFHLPQKKTCSLQYGCLQSCGFRMKQEFYPSRAQAFSMFQQVSRPTELTCSCLWEGVYMKKRNFITTTSPPPNCQTQHFQLDLTCPWVSFLVKKSKRSHLIHNASRWGTPSTIQSEVLCNSNFHSKLWFSAKKKCREN